MRVTPLRQTTETRAIAWKGSLPTVAPAYTAACPRAHLDLHGFEHTQLFWVKPSSKQLLSRACLQDSCDERALLKRDDDVQ